MELNQLLEVGERVEAKFKKSARFFAATVAAVHPPRSLTASQLSSAAQGTLDSAVCLQYTYGIQFDDGDFDSR